jgi:hypothetical protein
MDEETKEVHKETAKILGEAIFVGLVIVAISIIVGLYIHGCWTALP